ncbi:hypothetical protein Q3V37_14600 [Micromonospora profundi]|uniref:PH domain-containing protein n=1 Tax=Micromonospora profundi TaxID=1420889 RepID=A0AAJ6HW44_9ACTN|nr:hypothetical protein [Micromonospora profundi]WLS48350.1 hypothetical protein Q3V37_14600 [Micromonospora profundi]
MSPRVARLLIWPFAVAALALRICTELWFKPVTWRIEPSGLAFLAWVAAQGACFLLLAAGHALLTRRVRQRPAAWEIAAGAESFVASASPRWLGPWAILVGWLAAGAVFTERVPGEDRVRLAEIPGALALSIAVPAIVLAAMAAVLLLDRPRLILDRNGITRQGLIRRTLLRWDELLPGGPPPARGTANLTLMRQPATPGRPPVPTSLPTRPLDVDPAFLAETIRHYVEHPERRPEIGKRHELDRLRSELRAAPHPGTPT